MLELKSIKKLRAAMYGIDHAATVPVGWSPKLVAARLSEPPSYILFYAMRILFEDKICRGVEKSAWEIVLRYEDEVWLISDWKNYAWSVASSCRSEKIQKSLIKKLNSAAAVVDGILKTEAKAAQTEEKFSLRNDYLESRSIYLTYRKLYKKTVADTDPKLITGPVGDLRSSLVNNHFVKIRESKHHLVAMAVFFFAHTEVIMASCFSLLDDNEMKYKDYNRMEWAEKFKFVVGAEYIRDHGKQYSELVHARRKYRNVPVHSSPMFLFPIERIGLIPASYHDLNDPILSARYDPNLTAFQNIAALFRRTLRCLERHRSTRRGFYYARSGLPIHIEKEARDELRGLLWSRKKFIEEVQARVDLEYAMINGEL